MNWSASITSMNEGGRLMLSARSNAAPLDDKLRTVHATPLPPNATVPPFSTLWRGAARFSAVFSLMTANPNSG
jgi:hypothetical protein